MTVLAAQQFGAGPTGATLVPAGNESVQKTGGASLTYSGAKPVTGSFSARAQTAVGEWAYLSVGFAAAAGCWTRMLWTTPPAGPAGSVFIAGMWLGNVGAMDLRLNPDMTVTLRDRGPASSVARWTSPALPVDTRLRFAWWCAPGSPAGLQLRMYVGEGDMAGAAPTYDSGPQMSTSALTGLDAAHLGVLYAAAAVFSFEFDAVSVETTEPAAVVVNPLPAAGGDPPPVVDLGPDRTVTPDTATVVLQAAGSDPGGGIASYSWRVLEPGAPAMAGAGATRTVTSPILTFDRTWTYGVVAFDTAGQSSVEAQAKVTWLAVTEWHCAADLSLVPMSIVNADGLLVFITDPGTRLGDVGAATGLQLAATGTFSPPTVWAATGLPPGLTIAPATGLISGTPTVAGSWQVTATVTASGVSASVVFAWVISAAVSAPGAPPGVTAGLA